MQDSRASALFVVLLSLTACGRAPDPALREPAVPMINPLPIPDPANQARAPRGEPAEITLVTGADDRAAALCRGGYRFVGREGALYGHLPQGEAGENELADAPAALTGGSCRQISSAITIPLTAMINAAIAEDPATGRDIMAISCFRSNARQADLFCERGRVAQRGYAGQARWIAPPGFSEHATGLSVDFGARRNDGCNLRPCFADTAVGRWLAVNAPRFGFEMSFPEGNRQSVAHEPWHYRYVGSAAVAIAR